MTFNETARRKKDEGEERKNFEEYSAPLEVKGEE